MQLNVYPAHPVMPAQHLVFHNQTHPVLQAIFASQVPLVVVPYKVMMPIYVQLVIFALKVQQNQYLVFLVHIIQTEGKACYLNVSTAQLVITAALMV